MDILIVDDSRLDRTRIKRLIASAKIGAQISEAESAQAAIEMASVEYFDCVLIDYRLPACDGIELAKRLAMTMGSSPSPMIMLTGSPSSDLAEEAFASGVTDFLSKAGLSANHLGQTLLNAMIKQRVLKQGGLGEPGHRDSVAQGLARRQSPSISALRTHASRAAPPDC